MHMVPGSLNGSTDWRYERRPGTGHARALFLADQCDGRHTDSRSWEGRGLCVAQGIAHASRVLGVLRPPCRRVRSVAILNRRAIRIFPRGSSRLPAVTTSTANSSVRAPADRREYRISPPGPRDRHPERRGGNRRPARQHYTAGEAISNIPRVRTRQDEATVGSGPRARDNRPGPENREAAGVRGSWMPIARAQAPGAIAARIHRGIGLRLLVRVVLFSSAVTLVLTLFSSTWTTAMTWA